MQTVHQIEADWLLLNTCNFTCDYCYLDPRLIREKLSWLPSAREWVEAFSATEARWLLNVTGGEPTLYPELRELLTGLEAFCRFSFNTNLYSERFIDAVKILKPDSVSIIHVGIHSMERERRSGYAKLIRSVNSLYDLGFPIIVSCVATPNVIAEFPHIAECLSGMAVRPMPKMLQGHYRGRQYPRDYTAHERVTICTYVDWARVSYTDIEFRPGGPPTVWVPNEVKRGWSSERYAGRECRAGTEFVRIQPDGDVFRCGEGKTLGNLLARTFTPASEPSPCASTYCNHFCQKYAI